jgi:predicted ArsR family transcriptional regulator
MTAPARTDLLVTTQSSDDNDPVTGASLADPPPPLPAGSRRAEVLAVLRSADQPLSVTEVAEAMGLHVNTARFHLDGLVLDGLAERTTQPRETPGRPRILYSSEGPTPGPRSYELLAEMLTGLVPSSDAGPTTVELGQAWGRHLVDRAAPSERVDAQEAMARLDRVLDSVGFQPESRVTDTGFEVRLRHCPFLEVAQKHTDIVCAIHLGLMQGALDELGAPVVATSLEPFVTPRLCVAHLQATTAAS